MSEPVHDLGLYGLARAVCKRCSEPWRAGHICFVHRDGCPYQRRKDIHDICDSLAEEIVPPDVIAPIRAYADTLGECDCV